MASPHWNDGDGVFVPLNGKYEDNNVTFKFCDAMEGKEVDFSSGLVISKIFSE